MIRSTSHFKTQSEPQIEALSLTQLEDLSEALLDFSTAADLTKWLNNVM
ncbi:DUF4351 domain-containing protein [Nostoc sp. NMS4]|nr:DUF4351 domain-containing protein [Nostoc sp. NMS4]